MKDWRHATVDKVARGVLWTFRLIKGWLPRALGGAASLAFIVWGVMGAPWTNEVWIFAVGVVLALSAFVAEFVVQNPSYMTLSRLREEAERQAALKSDALERAIRIMLIRLGKHCRLEGHSDRISVYYFHDGRFFLVSRHAKNPTFEARGRDSYPAGEGAIGNAWAAEHGEALVSMPSGKEAWKRAAKRQGLSEETIGRMKMKSLGFAGYRLEAGERSVGVLMVESTTPNRVKQEHLDQISESHIVAALGELVASFAMMTPAGESIATASVPTPARRWTVVPRAAVSN